MSRDLCQTTLSFASTNFVMESFLNPWGEDDPILGTCVKGQYDENETLSHWAYLVQSAQPGELFLDVGSYAGLFSLVAAKLNRQIKIAAFEASTVTYGRLIRNISLNGLETSICPAHFAAWDETTTLEFTHRYGIYTMCPGNSAIPLVAEPDHVEKVHTFPLDGLMDIGVGLPGVLGSRSLGVKTFRSVAAIKIDIEGAEGYALRGATQILRLQRPHILCELLTDNAVSDIGKFISEYDYLVKRIGLERNYHLAPREKLPLFDEGYQSWKTSRKAALNLTGERRLTLRLF